MLQSLAQLRDIVHIDVFMADVPLKWLYHGSENEALARAARLLPPERTAGLIKRIIAPECADENGCLRRPSVANGSRHVVCRIPGSFASVCGNARGNTDRSTRQS
ncbi:hypothetical protein BUMB_03369c [Candidatus Paraburkholderia calva]|nr:hypothetical protein BUMB_03369c [Candidatus Paraburkholderia calva]